jgi:hypothetical protein
MNDAGVVTNPHSVLGGKADWRTFPFTYISPQYPITKPETTADRHDKVGGYRTALVVRALWPKDKSVTVTDGVLF